MVHLRPLSGVGGWPGDGRGSVRAPKVPLMLQWPVGDFFAHGAHCEAAGGKAQLSPEEDTSISTEGGIPCCYFGNGLLQSL